MSSLLGPRRPMDSLTAARTVASLAERARAVVDVQLDEIESSTQPDSVERWQRIELLRSSGDAEVAEALEAAAEVMSVAGLSSVSS